MLSSEMKELRESKLIVKIIKDLIRTHLGKSTTMMIKSPMRRITRTMRKMTKFQLTRIRSKIKMKMRRTTKNHHRMKRKEKTQRMKRNPQAHQKK